MPVQDTIQIRCSRCKGKFRDKARRVLSGYSRQCPYCEIIMFFDDGSANPDIREAVRNASAVRKALKEQEAEIAARRAAASLEEDEDGADHAPASSQHASRTVASTRTIAGPRGERRS